nr:SMP-30/gluconolactonase/LRE family protein [Niveibacterium umoris]
MGDVRCLTGECVQWDAAEARLLWTDIEARCLHAWSPASGARQSWPMPALLASFALSVAPGRLLLGLERSLASFDLVTGRVQELLALPLEPGLRVNDGRCDRDGNFVFGLKNEHDATPRSQFWRYTAEGALQPLALPPVAIANSLCFSRDGTRLYFADSLQNRMHCAAYNAASGHVSGVRPFGPHFGRGVEPDGAVVDAEDGVWCALWGGGAVARIDPRGWLTDLHTLPVSQAACPGFGGAALDTLYISSASAGLDDSARTNQPLAGAMFALRVPGLRGLADGRFGGAL